MSEFMKELNEMGKGEVRNKKSIVVVGYAPYNPNYDSIMRDRVITALEVYQRETHGLILIAGTEIETMSMEAYNNFAASLKFKGCPSTLSYMLGVPAGNKERLTDLKHVGTLTKRIGVLKSYF